MVTEDREHLLRHVLATSEPFAALADDPREQVAAASVTSAHDAGELLLDGFREPATEVTLVLQGRVGLWHEVESHGQPDETVTTGAIYGYSAMLTGRSAGPRALALTPVVVAHLPADVAATALATPAGVRFVAAQMLDFAQTARQLPGFATIDSLVDETPVEVPAGTSVREVARLLTENPRLAGVVVRMDDGQLRLATDGSLRRLVIAEGLGLDIPAEQALARDVPMVLGGDSAGEALIEVLNARTEAAIVTDTHGTLTGVLGLREFARTPATADVALHEQLRLAASRDELVHKVRQSPEVLQQLLDQGLGTAAVVRVYSGLVDAAVRRALELCLDEHPALPSDGFTWLNLGSNARREAVLTSDLESAVIFPDGTPEATMAAYREVFGEVHGLLARAGIAADTNGVGAQNAVLARTEQQWRKAAARWLAQPWQDKGAVMLSLMVDSRPVVGDKAMAEAARDLDQLRNHPATLKLLLNDALSHKVKVRMREPVWRRRPRIHLKDDAVTPLVDMGRWIGLVTHCGALNTPDRLRSGAGDALLAPRQAAVLAEGFLALQQVRLRTQLAQVRRGEEVSDRLRLDDLSVLDRSLVVEAVREAALAQRRLASVAGGDESEQWGR